MKTSFACLAASSVLFAAAATRSQDVISPGSTVDGEYLRGQGVFLKGAAWYEIESARARALDAQTTILVDQYLRELEGTYKREREAAYSRRVVKSRSAAEAAKRERGQREVQLRTAPAEADILDGDALNALLTDLSNPAVNVWTNAVPEVPLPGGLSIQKLAFQFIPRATSDKKAKPLSRCLIALGKLDKKGGWPAYMTDILPAERQAYELAYKKLIESCLSKSLGQANVKALDDAIEGLRKAASHLPKNRDFQEATARHIKELEDASDIFSSATIDLAQEMIRDTEAHDARTVGQLIAFMRKYRLMFAAADLGIGGVDAYAQIYGLMKTQKEKLGIKALPEAPAPIDKFQAGSVWLLTQNDGEIGMLTVLDRDGERFKGRFEPRRVTQREFEGRIKDGEIVWFGRDVRALRGGPGDDNWGTLNGDELSMHWGVYGQSVSGSFSLRLRKN